MTASSLFALSRSRGICLLSFLAVGCGGLGGLEAGSGPDGGRLAAARDDGGAPNAALEARDAGCGGACSLSEFCGRGSCHPADFSQLCQLPLTTVLLDEIAEDDAAGLSMSAALAARCGPPVSVRSVPQADGLLSSDGEPLALGELLVTGGGSFRQQAVRWLELNGQAHVSDTSTADDAIYSLRDGGVVSSVPRNMLGPTRDRIAVQVVRAPSGALVLSAQGFHGPGTLAAAYSFVQTLLPASASARWYVIEWEDLDATGGPTAADRYTVLASGS